MIYQQVQPFIVSRGIHHHHQFMRWCLCRSVPSCHPPRMPGQLLAVTEGSSRWPWVQEVPFQGLPPCLPAYLVSRYLSWSGLSPSCCPVSTVCLPPSPPCLSPCISVHTPITWQLPIHHTGPIIHHLSTYVSFMLPDIYYPSAARSLFEVPHFATRVNAVKPAFPSQENKDTKAT